MRHILFLLFVALAVTVSAQPQQADPQINNNPPVNGGNQINQAHGGLGNEDLNINDNEQVQQDITYNQQVQQSGTIQVNTNINWGSSQLSAASVNRASTSVSVTKHVRHSKHKKKNGSVFFTKTFSKKFKAANHYSGKHRFTMCHTF
jgi:hypothetical protein